MSIDRSLKSKDSLARHRNVLTRPERLEKLAEEERWQEGDSVLALPKVVHRKAIVAKKAKAAAETEGTAAASTPAEGAAPSVAGQESKPSKTTPGKTRGLTKETPK